MLTTKKQKILVLELDSRDIGYQSGIARYFDVLQENLPKHINVFYVIFFRNDKSDEVKIVESDNQISVYHPHAYPANLLNEAVIAFLGRHLVNQDNIIVKSNCMGMETLAYMLKSRFYCKTMGVLHFKPRIELPAPNVVPVNPFFNMDHVICVAENGVEYLAHIKNKRPFSVIHNGIAAPKITKTKKKEKNQAFRFLFVNGFSPNKGLEKILPAIEKVSKRHKIEVIVMGGGLEKVAGLKEKLEKLPVVCTGLIDDKAKIRSYYEKADAALFASASEACSYAGIEAMAYNLPIISTDCTGMQEMFSGDVALFAHIDEQGNIDTDQYAEHMMNIIESARLRNKLAIKSYARYLDGYTVKQMVKKTVALYESLVGK